MLQVQPLQVQPDELQPAPLKCRFEMTAADAPFSHEFCVFDFPACNGCPNALRSLMAAGKSEDPMKSKTWQGWIAHAARPRK
jgi:hypothetical protein